MNHRFEQRHHREFSAVRLTEGDTPLTSFGGHLPSAEGRKTYALPFHHSLFEENMSAKRTDEVAERPSHRGRPAQASREALRRPAVFAASPKQKSRLPDRAKARSVWGAGALPLPAGGTPLFLNKKPAARTSARSRFSYSNAFSSGVYSRLWVRYRYHSVRCS